jgi:hypothetical protein
MQPLSVKEIVYRASLEIGITQQKAAPAVFGSDDQDIVQMGALLNAVADEVLLEDPYRVDLGDGVWVSDDQGNPKLFATTDTDLVLFDSRLAINGLKYRFLQAKGWEFGEQLKDYTIRLNKLAGRINGKVIDLDADEGRVI